MTRDFKTDRTYKSWEGMKQRCLNPNNPRFDSYGGRGITIEPKWITFAGFLEDMGERPEGLTLDRIDNDGDYCKTNCRWASPAEQQRNTRQSKLTESQVREILAVQRVWEGSDRELARQFSRELGVNHETIREVLEGRCWNVA